MDISTDDTLLASASVGRAPCPAEEQLVAQIRQGDLEAGQQFVRDYYPGIYRYLLYLTARPDLAEDLTQETFLRAWRGLEAFQGRAHLKVWLYRIARREFLRSLRSQCLLTSLEETAEVAGPHAAEWMEAIELREVVRKLPREQGEIVVLHYLQGYNCEEIAQIVGAPAGTIKYRLSAARTRLQRELGDGDLIYLNELSVPMRQWAWLPLDDMHALAARLTTGGTGDRQAREAGPTTEDSMERREFLRQAAVGAAGLMLSETEKEVVDDRLTQRVTCAFKATALSNLCDQLRSDTGIQVTAGPSVADEKVTLLCEKRPLREVMRQLSRPFGYTWLRSGTPGQYRYELVQDLRSQLLEEELRNRDRNAALIALDQEIQRYRPYLDLSPDEALHRAKSAPPAEQKLLEHLSGCGWGPIQMYFRLSRDEQAELLAKGEIRFTSGELTTIATFSLGDRQMPPDIGRGVLQSLRDWRLPRNESGFGLVFDPEKAPGSPPPSAVPEAHPLVILSLRQSETGHFTLSGAAGLYTSTTGRGYGPGDILNWNGGGAFAVGQSPTVLAPNNAGVNARLAHDPSLRRRITVQPVANCQSPDAVSDGLAGAGARAARSTSHDLEKVTAADLLEALHRATGVPLVGDYYTRLYLPETVSVANETLFDALNRLGDAARLRWHKEDDWLQFRSISFYNDRLKEVPNRLLTRWSGARRQHGMLSLDEVVEIAGLSDAQLDAREMAEGAKVCFGLKEWDLARDGNLRPHLRFLAGFTPEQRQEMMSAAGLPFTKMSLAQQQGFLARFRSPESLDSPDELAGSTLRVEYTQTGWFTWRVPEWILQWVVPMEPGRLGRRVLMPPIRERTRGAALQTARRLVPRPPEAVLPALRRGNPQFELAQMAPQPDEIVPTDLDLKIAYIFGLINKHCIVQISTNGDSGGMTW